MASEAGPGEGPAPQARSEHLRGLASGPLVGESLGRPGQRSPQSCRAGAEAQDPAGGMETGEAPCEEAAVLWVEELPEMEVMEEDMVLENVMAVVDVVAEEEVQEQEREAEQKSLEEGQEECGRAQPGYDAEAAQTSVEALEALQLELSSVKVRTNRAFCRLKHKLRQAFKPHLERRSNIIERIRGFWFKTILNHPLMSAMISDQDQDMLNYMISLKVEELIHPTNSCKIIFFFGRNPYFQNEVITKEYDITITGYKASHSTPVQWLGDYECQTNGYSNSSTSFNFFNWLSDHNFAGSNRIAEIICEDLWLNPLQYYLRI
ncbi:testis-specific Y-encoded protein 4-like [Dasypus novemcinctus]|uniref:testis-specific Y-encoded protein 4-like n=1 Tax=Dasypus novemcinctus TaxID=9361 RepID=UPI0039C9C6D7